MNGRRAKAVRRFVAWWAGRNWINLDSVTFGESPAVRRKIEREVRRNARPGVLSGFHVQRTRAGATPRGKTRISGAEGWYFIDEPAPDAAWRERVARASTLVGFPRAPKRGRAAWLAAAMLAALAAGGGR